MRQGARAAPAATPGPSYVWRLNDGCELTSSKLQDGGEKKLSTARWRGVVVVRAGPLVEAGLHRRRRRTLPRRRARLRVSSVHVGGGHALAGGARRRARVPRREPKAPWHRSPADYKDKRAAAAASGDLGVPDRRRGGIQILAVFPNRGWDDDFPLTTRGRAAPPLSPRVRDVW